MGDYNLRCVFQTRLYIQNITGWKNYNIKVGEDSQDYWDDLSILQMGKWSFRGGEGFVQSPRQVPRLELIPCLVIKPRIFIKVALDDDDDMTVPGFFFFFCRGEAERGLCINRKSTLNTPIVFIVQTTVNRLKKKLGRWEYTGDSEKA